ncbi:MAG: hypothetical protein K8T90_09145 [Planctomycetes bacterium]|nr:hypothetical protein [Planctomycetota bacterium]
MLNDDPSVLVHDRDLELARHHAARAVGRAGLRSEDREDLEQEALVQLVRRIRQFDAARGEREGFVATVAQQAVSRVVEHRCAARRSWRRNTSLDAEVSAADGTTAAIADAVADDDHARRTRGARLNQTERDDLRLDVQAVLDRLPSGLRAVCELLMKVGPTEAAEALALPRGTLHDRTRRIRAHFREAGLHRYLASPDGARR